MTTIPDTPGPKNEPANKYTPDAQEWVTQLRTIAGKFPDEIEPKPLTLAEIRVARGTTVAALENAALFIDASPRVGGAVADSAELRDAIAFELAYGGVRDEARVLLRRIDMAILRRKLKAVKAARSVYIVAKGFASVDAGDSVRPHVTEMKRAIVRPRRRRKPDAGTDPQIAAKK